MVARRILMFGLPLLPLLKGCGGGGSAKEGSEPARALEYTQVYDPPGNAPIRYRGSDFDAYVIYDAPKNSGCGFTAFIRSDGGETLFVGVDGLTTSAISLRVINKEARTQQSVSRGGSGYRTVTQSLGGVTSSALATWVSNGRVYAASAPETGSFNNNDLSSKVDVTEQFFSLQEQVIETLIDFGLGIPKDVTDAKGVSVVSNAIAQNVGSNSKLLTESTLALLGSYLVAAGGVVLFVHKPIGFLMMVAGGLLVKNNPRKLIDRATENIRINTESQEFGLLRCESQINYSELSSCEDSPLSLNFNLSVPFDDDGSVTILVNSQAFRTFVPGMLSGSISTPEDTGVNNSTYSITYAPSGQVSGFGRFTYAQTSPTVYSCGGDFQIFGDWRIKLPAVDEFGQQVGLQLRGA